MAVPSLYQAQISTTISAPTKIVKDIQHIMVSTIIGSTVQTNTLNMSSLSNSIIQGNALSITTLLGSTIQTNVSNLSTVSTSTIQTNTMSFATLLGSTIQSNVLQCNSIIGCTIQTNTHNTINITGSSIQTSTINVSSFIGSSIQTNITIATSLIGSTIQTSALYVSSLLTSSIQLNTLNMNTTSSNIAQLNNVYVSTLNGNTLIGSTFQINTLNVSSSIGSTISTNTLQISTLTGSTIQTDSFIFSTMYITSTSAIKMNTLNVSTTIGSTIMGSTIQANQLGYYGKIVQIAGEYITFDLGTGGNYHNQYSQSFDYSTRSIDKINFVGSYDGIYWINLGVVKGTVTNMSPGNNRQTFNYILSNVRYLRIIFIELYNGTMDSQIVFFDCSISNNGGAELFPTSFSNILLSPNISPGLNYSNTYAILINIGNTYSPLNYGSIGYYTGSIYTAAFDINVRSIIGLLTTDKIQTNLLYFSTLIGSTIQTNTLSGSLLLGSTIINNRIQSDTLNVSSVSSDIIQINSISGNNISVSSIIQVNQINTSTIMGSTIFMNRLDTSTIVGSSIQASQIGVSTITGSTIQTNTLIANRTIIRDIPKIIAGEYITFYLGEGGDYHDTFDMRAGVTFTYLSKITFLGSNDGINWIDLGTSTITLLSHFYFNYRFRYTLSNNKYLRIVFIEITNINYPNQVQLNYRIINGDSIYSLYPASMNEISLSANISPGIQYEYFNVFSVNLQNTYSPITNNTVGYYVGSLTTTVWTTIENANKNIFTNTVLGSTIQSNTILGGTLNVSTMTGSTIIGNTVQTSQVNISTMIGCTMIASNFQANKLLITDANKALSTSATNASQLQYITGLVSQAGGIGQTNTWVSANVFNVPPIFNGLSTVIISPYTLGIDGSYKMIQFVTNNQTIAGVLNINYTPYASTVSTINNSLIYYVSTTDVAIGQTSSAIPTGITTTFTIPGLLQTTRLYAGTGDFSKIVMTNKLDGLNGKVISDYQGCNFYSGRMGNNGSGNLSDVLYLNSWYNWGASTFNTTDSFNIRNNIVVTSAGVGYETMPSFTPSSTALTFSALFICTGSTMPTTWARIFDIGNSTSSSGSTRGFLIAFHNNSVLWVDYRQADGTISSMSTTIQLKLSTMYHVVWTISSSGSHILYINGEQAATMTKVITFDTLPNFYLGRSNWTADSYPNMKIYDFRMMNRYLSTTEIQSLYNWEVSTYITADSYNIRNSVVVTNAGAGFVTMPSLTTSATTSLTFSALIIYTGSYKPAQWSRIFDIGNTTGSSTGPTRNFDISYNSYNGGTLRFEYRAPDDTLTYVDSSIQLGLNTIYHVVWTINTSGSHVMYINGTQVCTMTKAITAFTYPYFYLGKSNWIQDPYPDMTIFDFRMMNRYLSITEVQALYELLKQVNQTPYISGRYIVLNRPTNGWWNLAEIRAYSYPGGPNIITPTTSVTMSNPTTNVPVSNFVDGDLWSIIQNDGNAAGPLTVDLGSSQPIYKIVVYNRKLGSRQRANGTVLTIKDSSNTVIYTASPMPDKTGQKNYTETVISEDVNYNTFTYFPSYAAVIGDNNEDVFANIVMYDKTDIGMRIFHAENNVTTNYTTYKDALMTDINSANISLGQNSDVNGITFGPGGSYSGYLKIGSGSSRVGINTAQIISTDGNLYIDAASNGRILYLNAMSDTSPNYINSYTPWTHNSTLLIPNGSLTVSGSITASDWYYIGGKYGMYWNSYSRGIVSPEQAGNPYGHASTWGTGRNGWSGWGIGTKSCWMSNGTEFGIHDNSYSWTVYCNGQSNKLCILGGSCEMSQNTNRFRCFYNGTNTNGGYFYVNSSGGYGSSSDERSKKNIRPIDSNQSIAFINGIIPSNFNFKKEEMSMIEQSGFIAQNVWESAKKAGLPKSTVANTYDYEQELLLPDDQRKTLLGISAIPIISHSINALKALIQQVDEQQLQIDELQHQISISEVDINELLQIANQQNQLLQQLIANI